MLFFSVVSSSSTSSVMVSTVTESWVGEVGGGVVGEVGDWGEVGEVGVEPFFLA